MVQLALNTFLPRILGESVIVMSDNTTVVAYLKEQWGTVSRILGELVVLMSHITTVVAYLKKQWALFPGRCAVCHRRSYLGQTCTW